MVKVVTQETFDNYVLENEQEFGMSREEAIKEAKEQLEMQVSTEYKAKVESKDHDIKCRCLV